MHDVIVVGGGVVGAASAYFLSQAGVSTLLVEGEGLASQSSGKNGGLVSVQGRLPGHGLEMIRDSQALYEALGEELDADFGFRRTGGLVYYLDDCQRPLAEAVAAERREVGVAAELVDAAGVRELAPGIADDIPGGLFFPEDAQMHTPSLVEALVRKAEAAGATVMCDTPVTEVEVVGGRVEGVATPAGSFAASAVVIAAGVGSVAICRDLGVEVAMQPVVGHVVRTVPVEYALGPALSGPGALVGESPHHASLPGYEEAATVKDPRMAFLEHEVQTPDGRFMLGCPFTTPDNFDRALPTVEMVAEICTLTALTFPAVKGVEVERIWAGYIPHMADANPIIDRVPGFDGLFLAAGHSNGNMTGPATGEVVSRLVTGAETPDWLRQCAFGRPGLEPSDRLLVQTQRVVP